MSSSQSRSLEQVQAQMRAAGATLLLAKHLAPNDNSKNQIYFGPGFHALGLIPAGQLRVDISPKGLETLKAPVQFSWLLLDGSRSSAPGAQLILYPDYPEVRFSGLLQGSRDAPSNLVNSREEGRLLLLGITNERQVIGVIVGANSTLAREYAALTSLERTGVFAKVPLQQGQAPPRELLLAELHRIHSQGWIASKALSSDGTLSPCNSSNCVGYTLEAELGVARNGFSEPDFLGWEVKAGQANASFELAPAKSMTLLTPEPDLGVYREDGATRFVRRYGYPDKKGRVDRLNFGGVFRTGVRHDLTGLTLNVQGFDPVRGEIIEANGAIELRDDHGTIAAGWTFAKLATHWNRKHAQAVYVPALCETANGRRYSYGRKVRLGEGTDFLKFIEAVANGAVYYDPGIKLERASEQRPLLKRRSQFRVRANQIPELYASITDVEV